MPDIIGGPLIANQMNARLRRVWLDGDEDCPPFGAMEITGYTFDGGLRVRKPTADDIPPHLVVFASDLGVSAGSSGIGSQKWPCVAYYDDSFSISNREVLGTKANDWRLVKGNEGFLAVGKLSSDQPKYVAVMPEVVCRSSSRGHYGYLYGQGGDGFCCRCRRFLCGTPPGAGLSLFPATIQATVTAACIGTRTITLTRGDYGVDAGGCGVIRGLAGDARVKYTGNYLETGALTTATFEACNSPAHAFTETDILESLAVYLWCCKADSIPDNPADAGLSCQGSGSWNYAMGWSKIVSGDARFVASRGRVILGGCQPLLMSSGLMTATCQVALEISFYTACDYAAAEPPTPYAVTNCDACNGTSVQVDFNE